MTQSEIDQLTRVDATLAPLHAKLDAVIFFLLNCPYCKGHGYRFERCLAPDGTPFVSKPIPCGCKEKAKGLVWK